MDEAVGLWGMFVEGELQEAEEKGKKPADKARRRQARLAELLSTTSDPVAPGDDRPAVTAKRFADPADRFR